MFKRGDRVKINLKSSYRHYLDGLEGTVTAVYFHGLAVALESDPAGIQKIMGAGGQTGPVVNNPQRVFQFNEIEKI